MSRLPPADSALATPMARSPRRTAPGLCGLAAMRGSDGATVPVGAIRP